MQTWTYDMSYSVGVAYCMWLNLRSSFHSSGIGVSVALAVSAVVELWHKMWPWLVSEWINFNDRYAHNITRLVLGYTYRHYQSSNTTNNSCNILPSNRLTPRRVNLVSFKLEDMNRDQNDGNFSFYSSSALAPISHRERESLLLKGSRPQTPWERWVRELQKPTCWCAWPTATRCHSPWSQRTAALQKSDRLWAALWEPTADIGLHINNQSYT